VKASQYSAQNILLAEGDAYGADWKMVMVRHTLLDVTREKRSVFCFTGWDNYLLETHHEDVLPSS
jgi:hypothetical protein